MKTTKPCSDVELVGANGQLVKLLNIGPRPPVEVDVEIADLVRVLNENGYPTRASCSGHGLRPGNIALMDGRELVIARDYAEGRRIDTALKEQEKCRTNTPLCDQAQMREGRY